MSGSGHDDGSAKFMRLGKYMIDIVEMKKNRLLVLKYTGSRQINQRLPKTVVSVAVQKLILKLVIDEKFEIDDYNKMPENDQKIFKQFADEAHIDLGFEINDKDDLNEIYEILLGEYYAGNTGAKLKLKKFIEKAICSHQIGVKKGLELLANIK